MRTLIIPDIHHHIEEAERLIARFPSDQVLFLGDYFDNFNDSATIAAGTAEWLKASLQHANRIHLWGNHDLAYAFPKNPHLQCSGFTWEKCQRIQEILTQADWAQLKLAHLEPPNYLFTHAGVKRSLFEHPTYGLTFDRLNMLCLQALEDAQRSFPNAILDLSGVTWLRWWEMEILPDFHQIVGHTPDPKLRIHKGEATVNVCLDTYGSYIGLLTNDSLTCLDTQSGEEIPIFPFS